MALDLPRGRVASGSQRDAEFLWSQPTVEELVDVCERLRSSVPLGQSVSIGVTTWDGEEPSEALVRQADAALYRAKESGRNRVVAA